MNELTIALGKGRLAEISMDLFEKIGLNCSEMKTKTRKLIFRDEAAGVRFILVKASDVPTYIEYGAADIGIVGKDTLLQEGRNLYEMINLGFGRCRMCVCGKPEAAALLRGGGDLRVASKFTNIARNYFFLEKGRTVEIIKLNGSVELAPLVGLSDVIVDLVESGKTLEENGLCVLEDICDISARLVVNRVSMKMESERILDICDRLKAVLAEAGEVSL